MLVAATGSSIQTLLKPVLAKAQPAIEKRRLYPLRHPEIFGNSIGNAAAITYCVEHQLVPYSLVRRSPRPSSPKPYALPQPSLTGGRVVTYSGVGHHGLIQVLNHWAKL